MEIYFKKKYYLKYLHISNIILIFALSNKKNVKLKNLLIMKIKDFIAELQKYPNQNAEINLVSNLIDIDNEAYDKKIVMLIFSNKM